MIPISHKRDRETFEEKPKKILIYNDEGTCQASILALREQLATTTQNAFKIKIVNSNYLLTKNWEAKTHALVMGGGHCTFWENSLQQRGMLRIRHYVAGGGRYLGICAGAYFACATSIFSLAGQATLTKYRPLAFYQGTAIGPIVSTENHLAASSALAVKIALQNKKGRCYYLGGCAFDITEDNPSTEVLARFRKPFQGSAIIRCRVGQGSALLTGLHPEFFWKEEYPYAIAKTLAAEESFRQEIWETICKSLF